MSYTHRSPFTVQERLKFGLLKVGSWKDTARHPIFYNASFYLTHFKSLHNDFFKTTKLKQSLNVKQQIYCNLFPPSFYKLIGMYPEIVTVLTGNSLLHGKINRIKSRLGKKKFSTYTIALYKYLNFFSMRKRSKLTLSIQKLQLTCKNCVFLN